jgi:tetratricopeptide (TPR) repeat protein
LFVSSCLVGRKDKEKNDGGQQNHAAVRKQYKSNKKNTIMNELEILTEEALRVEKEGKNHEALKLWDALITKNPKLAAVYYIKKGLIYNNLNNYKKAAGEFSDAIRLNSQFDEAYAQRATCYFSLGDNTNAFADISKAIEIAPKKYGHLVFRAFMYQKLEDYLRMETDLNRAVSLGDNSWITYRLLADAQTKLEKYEEAVSSYDKALLQDVQFREGLLYNKGRLNIDLHKYPEGIKDLLEAKQIIDAKSIEFPHIDDLNFLIGEAYCLLNDHKTGFEYLKQSNLNHISVYISKELGEINTIENGKIFTLSWELALVCNSIRNAVFEAGANDSLSVSHYTSLTVADKLISKDEKGADNTLRYYNAGYMNDPAEGETIFELLGNKAKDLFVKGKENEENCIYIGSFLPSAFADNLVMWRTYGKENGEDAKGCSLTINKDFFDNKYTSYIDYSTANNTIKKKQTQSQSLHKVFYYSSLEKKIINDTNENPVMEDVMDLKRLIEELFLFIPLNVTSPFR